MRLNGHQHLAPSILSLLLLTGCGMAVEPSAPGEDGFGVLGWTQPNASFRDLDLDSGLAFAPQIAVEPDPADNDGAGTVDDSSGSAIAVWVERVDLNFFDGKPPVYHILASRWDGASWSSPATAVDTQSADFGAWAPRVSMDNMGNGVVVWQQASAEASPTGPGCDPVTGKGICTRIWARRYVAGTAPGAGWQGAVRIDDPTGFNAANPQVAMEPDGGGTGMALFEQYKPEPGIWTKAFEGAQETIYSMAQFNGALYAGQGNENGDGDVLQILTTDALPYLSSVSFNPANINSIRSLATFGDRLFAGLGDDADEGDVYVCNPAGAGADPAICDDTGEWTLSRNMGASYQQVPVLYDYGGVLYAGTGTDGNTSDGDVYACDPVFSDNEGTTLGTPTVASLSDEVNCTTSDWITTPVREAGATAEFASSMAGFNDFLYVGLSRTGTGGGAAIYYCNPLRTEDQQVSDNPPGGVPGDETRCTSADWYPAASLTSGTFERVSSLAVFGGRLYAGFGTGTGVDDQIWVCNPTTSEPFASYTPAIPPGTVCGPGDWTVSKSFGANYEEVLSLAEFDGKLFAGLGTSANTDGDVWYCDDSNNNGCEPGEWVQSGASDTPFSSNTYERVNALYVFDSQLFAGMGSGGGDGDLLLLPGATGWRIRANRLSAGTWTLAGIPIDAANGDAYSPRVGMDNAGNAMAVFIQRSPGNCFGISAFSDYFIKDGNKQFGTNASKVSCTQDRLYANRFNVPTLVWNSPGPTKISPAYTTPVNDLLAYTFQNRLADCYNMNVNGKEDKKQIGSLSEACVDISEVQLSMDVLGVAMVAFKTYAFNQPDEAWQFGGTDEEDFRKKRWDANNTFNHHEIHINTRRFSGGSGGNWNTPTETNRAIAQYFFMVTRAKPPTTGAVNESGNCGLGDNFTNPQDTDNGGSQVMNCNFFGLSLALEPDGGGTAMLVAERYSSPTASATNAVSDLIAYRYCITTTNPPGCTTANTWQYLSGLPNTWTNVNATVTATPTDPDAVISLDTDGDFGSLDAFSPQVGMDNVGNGMLVWTQKDGSGKWRIYSRRYCPVDTGASAGCAAVGWSAATIMDSNLGEDYFDPQLAMQARNGLNPGSVGNAMTVFNTMDGLLRFRIDASRWAPP